MIKDLIMKPAFRYLSLLVFVFISACSTDSLVGVGGSVPPEGNETPAITLPASDDNVMPTIIATSPSDTTTNIPLDAVVSISLSEEINPLSVTASNVYINNVAAAISSSSDSITLTPNSPFTANTMFTVFVENIEDLSGNKLASPYSFTFTTGSVVSDAGPVASHNIYYVSTSGNNSNDGLSITSPVQTLAKAVSLVEPGDAIELRAGTYAGAVISRPASENAWITIRPYKNESVTIDGAGNSQALYFYHDSCDPYDPAYAIPCQSMYWTVENLEIANADYYAVKIDTPYVKLLNNKIHDSVYDVIKVVKSANFVTIFGNEIYFTGASAVTPRNAQGVDIVGADNVWVANNYVHDIPSVGLYAKGNARNIVFENNIVENVTARGIMLGQSTDADKLIDGNYESYDGIIRNNLIINSGESCLATSSSTDVHILNNSCYDAASGLGGVNQHGAIYISNESTVNQAGNNIEIRNNIIHIAAGGPAIKIGSNALENGNASININNNIYWTDAGAADVKFTWGDKGQYNIAFSDWKVSTSGDANSLIANPEYADPANNDLTLLAGSPAINNAATTDLVSLDYTGASRPSSGRDIGAYESDAIIPTYGSRAMPTDEGKPMLFRYPYLQTSHPTQMKIMWGVNQSGNGMVYLRNTVNNDLVMATATSQLFSAANTSLSSDFYQMKAEFNNLSPNTEYVYEIVHDGVSLAKNVSMKTMPLSNGDTVRFIVLGDSGTQYSPPRNVRNEISRKVNGTQLYPHDFILGVGDIAYNSGTFKEFNTNFFSQLSGLLDSKPGNGILATRPFFPMLGNHEYANNKQSLAQSYLDSFDLPTDPAISPEDRERYYSFDAGDVHFVAIDSMKFSGSSTVEAETRVDEMLAWLENDLQKTSKTRKFAFFHHAIFSHGAHGTYGDIGDNRSMRQKMAPILQKYGVKLAMFGHDHMYQRSVPLKVGANGDGRIVRDANGVIDQTDGVVYVLTGHGGADSHSSVAAVTTYGTAAWDQQVADWGIGYDFVAKENNVPVLFATNTDPRIRHGFTHVEVTPTQVVIKAYKLNTTDYTGELMDQTIIPKQ